MCYNLCFFIIYNFLAIIILVVEDPKGLLPCQISQMEERLEEKQQLVLDLQKKSLVIHVLITWYSCSLIWVHKMFHFCPAYHFSQTS